MVNLTDAQRRALEAMPLEYMEWRFDLFGTLPDGVKSRATLHCLERNGLAQCEYGDMIRRWTTTPAGRQALEARDAE